MTKPASIKPESQALADWFASNRRDLPWRQELENSISPEASAGAASGVGERATAYGPPFDASSPDASSGPAPHRDPYRTWISEIMLQQTQVSTVVDYFNRWMKRFPDVVSLAAAEEGQVMEAWAGLGYYSRARNVLATARQVVGEFGGRFPWKRSELLSLKGIGEYTAGAIASLSFNRPEPILDGNLVRVFSRLYGLGFLPDTREGKAAYWDLARVWVESHEPALINEGLMELGATVCTPKNPDCAACPLSSDCIAFADGAQNRFPPAKPRKEALDINGFVVVAHRGGEGRGDDGREILLYRPRKPELLAGLLTFPVVNVADLAALKAAWARLLPGWETSVLRPRPVTVTHSITHHRIKLRMVETAPVPGKTEMELPEGFLWAPMADMDRLLVSSLPRKIWKSFAGNP
jgi:A/G-specific adenine glycosylase